jgi:hypothetical protein
LYLDDFLENYLLTSVGKFEHNQTSKKQVVKLDL